VKTTHTHAFERLTNSKQKKSNQTTADGTKN